MRDYNTDLYYTLIWSSTLDSKKGLVLNGLKITKDTKLPKDPTILYGAHSNDVAKIKKIRANGKVTYDCKTATEKYECYDVMEEYVLPRDVFIIVWPGGNPLYLDIEPYRIVTPQVFEDIVSRQTVTSKDVLSKDTSVLEKYIKPETNKIKGILRKETIRWK